MRLLYVYFAVIIVNLHSTGFKWNNFLSAPAVLPLPCCPFLYSVVQWLVITYIGLMFRKWTSGFVYHSLEMTNVEFRLGYFWVPLGELAGCMFKVCYPAHRIVVHAGHEA